MLHKTKEKWFIAYVKKKNFLSIQNECKKYNIELFKPTFISNNNTKIDLFPNIIFIKCNSIENICCIQKLSKKISIVGNPFPESIPLSQIRKLKKLSKLNIPLSFIKPPSHALNNFININSLNFNKPSPFKINLLGKIIYLIPKK